VIQGRPVPAKASAKNSAVSTAEAIEEETSGVGEVLAHLLTVSGRSRSSEVVRLFRSCAIGRLDALFSGRGAIA